MINFIICDDEDRYRVMAERIITNYMMKSDIEYKTHIYEDYDADFMELVNKRLSFKVYILDIETPTKSGLDIARIIRNKDVDSVIIFLTGHQELSEIVIKNEFLFLSFINKFDDCENRLARSVEKAMQVLKTRRTIKFRDNGITYKIALDDILYVIKDSIERKCIIKTDYTEFKVCMSLTELLDMLNDHFVQTHRACIVNKKRIVSYNKNKRIIMFDNGETVDLVSTRFEEELV